MTVDQLKILAMDWEIQAREAAETIKELTRAVEERDRRIRELTGDDEG